MDSAITNAFRKREELLRELRDVEHFLTLYKRFKGESSQQASLGLDASESDEQEVDGSGPLQDQVAVPVVDEERALARLTRVQLRPIIAEVLREIGRPLTRGQILRKLDQRNVTVGGSYDRSKNMGTIMWRLRRDFVNLPGRGYWLRGTPFPEGGYAPGSELWDAEMTSDFDETLG